MRPRGRCCAPTRTNPRPSPGPRSAKRYGSNHRPWSELPETKAGIDARIADSQRCVAVVDVAHCHSFFADVNKAEDVDAFDASGTA